MNRRRLMFSQNEEKFLKHWWSGEDALVDDILLDRMGTNFGWKLVGDPQQIDDAWVFDSKTKFGSSTIQLSQCDLGNHFAIELDADLNPSIYTTPSVFLDFGNRFKYRGTMGFHCIPNGVGCFWQMGGDTPSPIPVSKEANYPTYMKLPSGNVWTPVKIMCEIRDRGNGYDEFVATYNEYSYTFEADVPKVKYNFNALQYEKIFLSRSANSAVQGIGMKLRNLKIYVFD